MYIFYIQLQKKDLCTYKYINLILIDSTCYRYLIIHKEKERGGEERERERERERAYKSHYYYLQMKNLIPF